MLDLEPKECDLCCFYLLLGLGQGRGILVFTLSGPRLSGYASRLGVNPKSQTHLTLNPKPRGKIVLSFSL